MRKLGVMNTSALPAALAEIVDDFQALSEPERLQLLLEFSRGLPELPERLKDHPETAGAGGGVPVAAVPDHRDRKARRRRSGERAALLQGTAGGSRPPGAFAGVLHEGLDGLSPAEILAVPDDMPELLGLTRAITPLRMRGMTAMLGRIKRKVSALSPSS